MQNNLIDIAYAKMPKISEKFNNLEIVDIAYTSRETNITTLLKMVQKRHRTVGFSHTLGISHHHHDKRGHRFKIKD